MILSGKERGKYKAFPTVVRAGDEVVVAYREGVVDPTKPHGRNGKVKILKSSDLEEWQEFETPFNDNELDAILSGPFDNRLALVTRSYEHKRRNDIYISLFKINSLPKKRVQVVVDRVTLSAFFGHIFELNYMLIASAYGLFEGQTTPLILASQDKGESWKLKSAIAPKGFMPSLNEASIVNVNGKFLAIMRSQEPSYDLFYSFSNDLQNWDEPKKLGFLGHAPIINKLSDGRLALVFRDLNDDLPGVGLAISSDNGLNWDLINICHYTGNLYNGGYADLVELGPNRLFIVYYISDDDNEPWIEAEIIDL